jgi:hypothetical protein
LFDQFRKYAKPKNKVVLFDQQTELLYGGEIKVDFYGARHALTLNKEITDDTIDQFRQRSEASFVIKHKLDPHREAPVAEGKITIGNTIFWRTGYPAGRPTAGASLSNYDLVFSPINANMQEAWAQIHIDQLFSNNEPVGLSIKYGLFPFLVGRGISLGDWSSGGSSVYGFVNTGVESRAPKFPPGLLVSGTILKDNLSYNLYFSPAVTEEVTPDSISGSGYATASPLDNLSDRHIVAGKLSLLRNTYRGGTTYFEPYFVFYNSPRNTVRTAFDAPLKFLTVGCMLDHKAGGFEINIEAARQFGKQKVKESVYGLRPNHEKFIQANPATGQLSFINDDSDGNPRPNLFAPTTAPEDPTILDPTKIQNGTTGNYYAPLPSSYDEWQSYQYQNYYQYHPAYEFDLAGRMAVCDMRYTFSETPLQIAAAIGYFSGDKYPFNDNVDNYFVGKPENASKSRTNFLPLRDYHYTGLWAYPMVMFNSGLVPRPYNLNNTTLLANNEITAATNITYLCLGFTVSPTDNLYKFTINPNVCLYWSDSNIPAWDKTAAQPDLVIMEENYAYNNAYQISETNTDKFYQRINGWEGTKRASSNLGWELNCLISYHITEKMELKIKAGLFFPGQRYADLAGQPNVQTMRSVNFVNADGTWPSYLENKGLGKDMAYGINARIGYTF